MIFKLSRCLFFIGLFAFVSVTAFAEGDVVCSGRVMGSTTNFNANFGKLYFDTHGAPAGGIPVGYEDKYDQVVDVSILDDGIPPDETVGLAPADRADAACVSEGIGDFSWDGVVLNNYEYQIEEYAWSDNLGFIDFLGEEDFGVKVGPDVAGTRELAGYAWSGSAAGPVFGYIQFKGLMADLTPYGVTMNSATGMLSGYAWSDAGVWIDFTGVQIELPDEEPPVVVGTVCGAGVEYVCVDVSIHEEINDYWYDLEVYLMEDDGVTPLDLTVFDLAVDFVWEDTIKLNQLAYSIGNFGRDITPVDSGGGILSKPISIANSAEFLNLFQEVEVDTGHYQLQEKIRSLAPTSASNVSLTTSTLPPLAVNNEFFANELSIGGDVWTDNIEPNELILKRIDYDIKKEGIIFKEDIVYPGNLGSGYRFEFAPVVEVSTLYAGDNEDTIIGFRNVPISFTMKESHNDYLDYFNAEVYVMLDFNETETVSECSDKDWTNFEYYFTDENVDAVAVDHAGYGDWIFTSVIPDPYASAVKFELGDLTSEQVYNAVVALPEYDPEDPEAGLPCDVVQGPTLYTVVQYEVSAEGAEPVFYYSNKVPRILSAAYNPAAIIHGNVYAPKAFSPTASHETQETGYLAVNIVRNTINENINKYLGEIKLSGGGSCTITEMNSSGDVGSDCAGSFEKFKVGEEHVLYFNETDVHLDMGDPAHLADSKLYGDWVIVVQDARVFIDNDLYHENPADGKLVLISTSTYEGSCEVNNIYLHADVKNIDANIVADCSLFPYHPDVAMPGADGIPDWTFEEKIEYLDKQKLFRGSIASRNTIGGADLDSLAGKEYLLLGTGEVAELPVDLDTRLDAQNYDLNYMAFFTLAVELADNGLPIDQRCQKALTIEDMVAINEGGYIEGENGQQCDGIDLAQFDPNTLDGDLVVLEEDRVNLARGLDESDFNPVYVYAVSSGSFVFEKSGEVTSWN